MKKHFAGFCIAFLIFFTTFYFSPIVFTSFSMGHGSTLEGGFCGFYTYTSNHFQYVFTSSCDYITRENAIKNAAQVVDDSIELIEPLKEVRINDRKYLRQITKHREDVQFLDWKQENMEYFCLTKVEDSWTTQVCSSTIQHVLEFEEQILLEW